MNDLLAPSYVDGLAAEAELRLAAIMAGIKEAVEQRNPKARHWLTALQDHVALKYAMSVEDRSRVCRLLFRLLHVATDLDLQTKTARVLASILKEKPPFTTMSDLKVAWWPLFDLFCRSLRLNAALGIPGPHAARDAAAEDKSSDVRNTHLDAAYVGVTAFGRLAVALRQVVCRARRFFVGADGKHTSALSEILDHLEPLFDPLDAFRHSLTQGLLVLFAPVSSASPAVAERLLPLCFKLWPLIENQSWNHSWFSLLSRVAEEQYRYGGLASLWQPTMVSQIFSKVLSCLDVAIANSRGNVSRAKHQSLPELYAQLFAPHPRRIRSKTFNAIATWIIYSCVDAEGSSNGVLEATGSLLATVATYFHPSNSSGAWSGKLAALLEGLTTELEARIHAEKNLSGMFPAIPQAGAMQEATVDHLVDVLLGLAMQGLYSKDGGMQSAAQRSLQALAWLSPAIVINRVTEEIFEALESVTSAYKAPTALSLLSYIAMPMIQCSAFDEGPVLRALMPGILPGIDTNDRQKTSATLASYYAILISKVDWSRSGFEDWASQFLRRLVTFFEHEEAPSGGKSSSHGEKMAAQVFDQLLGDMLRLFFARVPERSRADVLQKVWKELGGTAHASSSDASHWYYILAEALPTLDGEDVVSLCVKKTVECLLSEGKLSEDVGGSETKWRTTALCRVIDGAAAAGHACALVDHQGELSLLVKILIQAEGKSNFDLAVSLVDSLLSALTGTVAVPLLDATKEGGKAELHPTVGHVSATWAEPTAGSLAFAKDLIELALGSASEVVGDSPPPDTSKKELTRRCLSLAQTILAGGALLLQNESLEVATSTTDPYLLPVAVTRVPEGATVQDGRQRIAALLATCHERVSASSDDVTSLTLWASVAGAFLERYSGVERDSGKRQHYLYHARKSKYSSLLSGDEWESSSSSSSLPLKRRLPSAIAAARLQLLHEKRRQKANGRLKLSEMTEPVLEQLLALSFHRYIEVRKAGQEQFQRALSSAFHKEADRHIDLLLAKLATIPANSSGSDGGEKEDVEATVKGCLHLLGGSFFLRKVARKWRLLSGFLRAVLSTQSHDSATIQKLVLSTFLKYSTLAYTLAWSPLQPLSSALHPSDAAAIYRNALEFICGILAPSEGPAPHWRYQVMGVTSLVLLLRVPPSALGETDAEGGVTDTKQLRDITGILLAGLLAPIPAVRQLAVVGLVKVCAWCLPSSASGSHLNLPSTVAAAVREKVEQKMGEEKWVGGVLSLMAEEHHVRTEAEEAQKKRTRNVQDMLGRFNLGASAMAMAASFLSSSSGQEDPLKHVTDLVSALAGGAMLPWPRTWAKCSSSLFSPQNCTLISLLLACCEGDAPARYIQAVMEEYAATDSVKQQVTSFELAAALLRDPDGCGRSAALSAIRLSLASSFGSSQELATAIRFACAQSPASDLIPSALEVLGVGSAPKSLSVGQLGKQMEALTAVVIEARDPEVASRVADHVQEHFLAHAYLSVRMALAELILELVRCASGSGKKEFGSSLVEALCQKAVEESEEGSFARETLLLLLLRAGSSGVLRLLPLTSPVLPIVLHSVCDAQMDISSKARASLALISQVLYSEADLAAALAEVAKEAEASEWRVRAAALPFLQLLFFVHRMASSEKDMQKAVDVVLARLEDEKVEVRELASNALSSLLRGKENDEQLKALGSAFSAAAHKYRKRKAKKGEDAAAAKEKAVTRERKRHAAVLGLAALARVAPYGVPSWLPEVLCSLARYNGDAPTIDHTVKAAFQEFWRTHQEEWSRLRVSSFTQEQADTISDMLISPSYYG